MLDLGCMIWLRREPVVYKNVGPTTVPGFALAPADPLRFAAIVSGDASAPFGLDFFNGVTIGGWIRVGSVNINMLLGEEDFGDLIKLPIYTTTITTPVTTSIISLSYNPQRYATYQRIVHEYISQYSTPGNVGSR